MEEQKKSRKPLLIGIIAAVVVLAGILALVLTQCVGGEPDTTDPTDTTGQATAQAYDLYWNVDRAKYQAYENQDGEAAGTTGRKPNADGYYTVLFAHEGEQVELLVENRRLVNIIDGFDVMGLVFNADGLVVDVLRLADMPLEQVAWQFYIQSFGGKKVKFNSSADYNGMETMVEINDNTKIYDVSGCSEYVGVESFLQKNDRVMVVANELGEITHIFVYGRDGITTATVKYCKHCGEDVEWENWFKTDTLPTTTGHYFLENDITLAGQQMIQEDNHVCLDLNGKTVTGRRGHRMYSNFFPATSLAIMDNSEEKTGKMVPVGENMDQGNILWCRYGTMDMYDITLDASGITADVSGVAVEVSNTTVFTMHSGKIIGGKAIKAEAGTYGSGGSLWVRGTFIMHSGEITGGQSVAAGGNILLGGGGKFVMNGGKITDGIAYGAHGGNISIAKNAVFEFNDGIISGGTATIWPTGGGAGGNIYMNGTLEMNGGVITGGRQIKTDGTRNDHYSARNIFNVNGTINMYGGHIFGYVNCIDTSATDKNQCRVYLSGLAHIDGAMEGDYNLYLDSRVICDVGKLIDGAHISVQNTGIFSTKTLESNVKYFSSDHEGVGVVYVDNCLATGKIGCMCGANEAETHALGCTKELLYWQPMTTVKTITTSGNYYLTHDSSFAGQIVFGKNTSKDAEGNTITPDPITVALDTNGYNLEAPKGRAMLAWGNATVYFCNSRPATGGVIAGSGYAPTENADGTLSYNHSATLMTSGSGSVINILPGVTMTAVENKDMNDSGVLRVSGTLNMYGGKIVGGYARSQAGNILMVADSVFNMYAGEIADGVAGNFGGNVYMSPRATFNMYGDSKITGGANEKAQNGGSVYIATGATFNMTDNAVVSGGMCGNSGGNFYVNGTLNITGNALVKDGMGFTEDGTRIISAGNIFCVNGTVRVADNATIKSYAHFTDTSATDKNYTKLVLAGSPNIDGAPIGGNNIYLNASSIVEVEGVLADDCKIGLTSAASGAFTAETVAENADNFFAWRSPSVTGFYVNIEGHEDNKKITFGRVACLCGANEGEEHIGECDGTPLVWTAWTTSTRLPNEGGNWFLVDGDGTNDGKITVTGWARVTDGFKDDINVDLNGIQVTSKAGRVYDGLKGDFTLNISDSSEGHTGFIKSVSTSTEAGHLLWVNRAGQTYSVYRVTMDASEAENASAIYVSDGDLNLYNATVYGSKVATNGAAIYGAKGGTLINIVDSTIIGGTATANGGTIYLDQQADLVMTGGLIDGGRAVAGGNLFVNNPNGCDVDISGGTIQNGVATNADGTPGTGHNIWANAKTFKISGTTKVLNGDAYLFRNLILGEWEGNGKDDQDNIIPLAVNLRGAPAKLAVAADDTVDLTGYETFFSVREGLIVTNEADGLWVRDNSGSTKKACLCGANAGEAHIGECTGTVLDWEPWLIGGADGNNIMPNTEGNWYIVDNDGTDDGNVTVTNWVRMTDGATDDIKVDLNGVTVTSGYGRVYDGLRGDFTLTITDSSQGHTGKIASISKNADAGHILWSNRSGQKYSIYRATLDGSASENASAVYISNGDLYLYKATLYGAKNASKGAAIYGGGGNAMITLNDSRIVGGTATNGGAIYLDSGADMTMLSGVVEGGKAASGGNIAVNHPTACELTISGGTIQNGEATDSGDNVWANAAIFKISGTAKILNGDVYLFKNLILGEWEGNGENTPMGINLRTVPGVLAVAESNTLDISGYASHFVSVKAGQVVAADGTGTLRINTQ